MTSTSDWFADSDDIDYQYRVLDQAGHGREAKRSFGILRAVLAEHGLVDVRRLGRADSRNHARLIRLVDGTEAVLKLTMVAEGNETGALQAWQQPHLAGVVVPHLWAYGYTDDGYGWTVQQHLPGSPPALAVSRQLLAVVVDTAHLLHLPCPRFPSVLDILHRRLARAASSPQPDVAHAARTVTALLEHVATDRDVLLHGDFAGYNLLYDEKDQVVRVVDPAGFSGPAEYDTARYLGRTACIAPVASDVAAVAEQYRMDCVTLAVLTAAELVDMAQLALVADITGRGPSALAGDAVDTVRSHS